MMDYKPVKQELRGIPDYFLCVDRVQRANAHIFHVIVLNKKKTIMSYQKHPS